MYFTIGDGFGHGVVGLDRSGGLLVTEFHEDDAYVEGFARGNEQSSQFGFGCGCHYVFDNVGDIEDGTIVWWYVCIGGKKEVAARSTASLRFAEVAGVTVHGENHVAGMVGENCVFLRGEVVEEL